MVIRSSSSSGIPFGNTAARPASPSLGQPYFNGEVGRLELYSSTGWQNIVQETPGVASASGTYNQSAGSGTFTVTGTNFVDGAIAYAVGTNGIEYQATTTTYNSLVQLTVVFSNLSVEYEPYDIKITNPSNLFGLLPDAFSINDSPVWSTTAGSLGTYTGSSIQLSATDDETTPVYSITSGSLPTGLSMSSGGLISGTVNATAGTYTFTVSASDGINSAVTRSFSIVVGPISVTGGTLTSDSTYYYRTFIASGDLTISNSSLSAADILIVAGGGGTGYSEYHNGGAGGGGFLTGSKSLSPSVYSIVVGGGGAGGVSTGYTPSRGSDSTAFSATALGGGYGGTYSTVPGGNGGSGGGGAENGETSSWPAGSATQGNSGGLTGYGYAGGAGNNITTSHAGGGGGAGGAGEIGIGGSGGRGGNGGAGRQWLNGSYYAGGGGGAAYQAGVSSGGVGGGGAGRGSSGNGGSGSSNGTANTGGGAGGYERSDLRPGATGGSGIVIVRYTKASVGG